ncbi:MAG: AraC family transcriptional regulator [Bacteroidales bacterium]|nr:AraC family transcriptional regulator [Bacteroidales bacterium]
MYKNQIPRLELKDVSGSEGISFVEKDFAIGNEITILKTEHGKPFHCGAGVVVVCLSGVLEISIDLTPYKISRNQVLVIMPDQIFTVHNVSEDYRALYILASKGFANEMLPQISHLTFILYLKGNPVLNLTESNITVLQEYIDILSRKAEMKDTPYRREIIRHIAMAVVYEAYRMLEENHIPDVALSGKERIFRDFLALVKDNYKKDKTIAPYAKRLCISTKYLSLLTKELSGKTASYWIDQYVMLEARSLLSSTNLTIKQIAFELGFSSQSFFGKYFSRMEGVSPKKFRSR